MATPVLIPVSEYLGTTYRPDRDYVDGELKERNVGERPHGLLQGIFFTIFQNNQHLWRLLPILEQRVQTSATRFRIPDLCLVRASDPADALVHLAPVLCLEILSRDDSLSSIRDRVSDYFAMGVEQVWVVDPISRLAYRATEEGYEPAYELLTAPGTPIRVELDKVFARLDDLQAGRF